jgi:peptidoglycan/xylan/chitin deacetylase (PgdA/CDA1 family)
LTFDDGPYGNPTNQILDILKEKKVVATFFVVGNNVEKYPDIAQRELTEGHIVGNHSYDHADMGNYSALKVHANLKKSEEAIIGAIGVAPALFRAPYGTTSPIMFTELAKENFTYVGWNEDPDDWNFNDEPSEKILKDVLKNAQPNGVIILHDGRDIQISYPRSNTISALPFIIDHLRNRGFTFTTVDKMLNIVPYKK